MENEINERKSAKMSCICKYILTNEDERRVLKIAKNRGPVYWHEDNKFLMDRYYPTFQGEYIKRYLENNFFDFTREGREFLDKAYRKQLRGCIKEAQKIKRRQPNYRNIAWNLGLFFVDCTLGGLVTVVGGMGGGIRWVPAERKQNYL